MSMIRTGPEPDENGELYMDGRTKQSFKDSTDINKLLSRHQRAGTLSHLAQYEAQYADFSDVPDLLTAQSRLAQGQKMFDELPSQVRREFKDQFEFFEYVNNPVNAGRLSELLPPLAEPGRQRPDVRRSAGSVANPAVVDPPSEPPVAPPSSPPGATE